jgi:hypothetical protein
MGESLLFGALRDLSRSEETCAGAVASRNFVIGRTFCTLV